MQFKKFMFLGAAAVAMASCGEHENLSDSSVNESAAGQAYVSLAIEMPTSGAATRADVTSPGTEGEQTITDLSVFIWEKDGSYENTYHFDNADLIPQKPNTSASQHVAYYTTKAMEVKKGEKKIIVVVNGGKDTGLFGKKQSIADFRAIETQTKAGVAKLSEAGKFLMTNAAAIRSQETGGQEVAGTVSQTIDDILYYADGTVGVNVDGKLATPTTVTVPVERVVAKLTEQTTGLTIQVKDASEQLTGDEVTFTHVALVNGNTKFFPIKNIRPSDDPLVDYVVDPNFSGQWPDPKDPLTAKTDDFYAKAFVTTPSEDNHIDWTEMKGEKLLFYTLENTMVKDEQKNAFTTGFYYAAEYKLKDVPAKTNLYKFNGKLYSFTQLEAAKLVDLSDLNDQTSSKEQFAAKGIVKYEQGICFYPYWIRHNSQGAKLSAMKFGVVRNNDYQMHVDKVKGIGFNTPVNPEPGKPDEVDAMLEVVVKVLPWTVRDNGIEF